MLIGRLFQQFCTSVTNIIITFAFTSFISLILTSLHTYYFQSFSLYYTFYWAFYFYLKILSTSNICVLYENKIRSPMGLLKKLLFLSARAATFTASTFSSLYRSDSITVANLFYHQFTKFVNDIILDNKF